MTSYLALLLVLVPLLAQAEPLSPAEREGRSIYHQGRSADGPPMTARLQTDGADLPAEHFPCVNCHGEDGNSTREGSITIPGIAWNRLATPMTVGPRARPAYDESALARAVTEGLSPAGQALAGAMPRYRMTAAQLAALSVYLKQLGGDRDTEPSITPNAIGLGSKQPPSGAEAATGQLISQTLAACMASINAQGGIYGRKLEWVTGSSDGIDKPVLAYLASYWSEFDESPVHVDGAPSIGPIGYSPRNEDTVFRLLSDLETQAIAALDFAVSSQRLVRPQIAIVAGDEPTQHGIALTAARHARQQRWALPRQLRLSESADSVRHVVDALSKTPVDAVLFAGNGDQLHRLAEGYRGKPPLSLFIGLMALTGRGALNLPAGMARRTLLASPFDLADQAGLQQLSERLAAQRVKLVNPGIQAAACGAVDVFAEAAKQAGQHLSTRKLLAALEGIRELRLPLLPNQTFGPSRRSRNAGAFMVEVKEGRLMPVSGWIKAQVMPAAKD